MKIPFCDLTIQHKKLEREIKPVHLYGYPANLDRICKIAKNHNLRILTDCAHATG